MDTDSLRAAELRLQEAQLHSDVDELDRLLHPDLVFVGPDGAVHTKVDDLEWHRTGVLRVDAVDHENLIVRVNDGVGVTVFTATIAGDLAGSPFSSRMRYTRGGHGAMASGASSSPMPVPMLHERALTREAARRRCALRRLARTSRSYGEPGGFEPDVVWEVARRAAEATGAP